jgi:glyoxylase-like metal-dependent hydrolase (beta-lactamase superfamily II)
MKPEVKAFFDKDTSTLTYVVSDSQTKDAVIIDPVWDYDPASSKMAEHSAQKVLDYVKAQEFKVHHIIETHAHADHVSGAQVMKPHLKGATVGIGANIVKVQSKFKKIYNLDPQFPEDGSQFDFLIQENKPFKAGSLEIEAIYTPGHTPACSSYIIGDTVFTGDALFMPDFGTGRCDFPMGSADDLYTSVHDKLYKLPDETRVFTGHDYQPGGRELRYESSIGEEKKENIQLKAETTREEYVKFRTERDAKLNAPRLLLPSIQVNIDAGKLPSAEENGKRYLKIPLNE